MVALSNTSKNKIYSTRNLFIFFLVFAFIGAYILVKSFASTPTIATLQAENMTLPAGSTVVTDNSASGGKAVMMSSHGYLSGQVNLPSNSTSLSVMAKAGSTCHQTAGIRVLLDNSVVIKDTTVKGTNYTSINSTALNTPAGTHNLKIYLSNPNIQCNHILYVDVTNFYGPTPPPPPAPTVALSANPTSLTAGQSSTLTWTSTNTSSCTASGAWSGSEPTSGSTTTGALNTNSTYTLTCLGPGGTATQTANITVASSGGGGTGAFTVGLNEANWGDGGITKVASAVQWDRADADVVDPADLLGGTETSGAKTTGYLGHGVKVDLLFSGPYNKGGVSALVNQDNGNGATDWANAKLAYYKKYCSTVECTSIEVLNEPDGWWFWGTGSGDSTTNDQTNATAYAKLVQTTYTIFHSAFGSSAPLILGAYDGTTWGHEWWNSSISSYVDGVIVHPYGGNSNPSQSKLGNRAQVTEAHTYTAKPAYVTEVGWPTDTTGTVPTTTNATGDSMQWPQSNAAGANQGDQCDNVYNFIQWARSTKYVGAVYIFGYADYGSNAFYGMFNSSGSTSKPAFGALKAASLNQANPCPNPLTY